MPQIRIDTMLGPGLISKGIAWFGNGFQNGYSHSASMLADGRYLDAHDNWIADVPPGVHIREAATEIWVKRRRATLEVSEEEYATWEASLRAKITDGYGREDILAFIDPWEAHRNGRWICSALSINAVQHVSRVHWHPGHLGFVPYPLPVPAHQIPPNTNLMILATAGFTLWPEETQSPP
jgi:hypothetical protein